MVRLKIYGIFSLFLFSIPKFFNIAPQRDTTIKPKPKELVVKTKVEKPSPKPTTTISKPIHTATFPKPINVVASVYYPVVAQTDSTPFTTADGSRINKKKPGKHRWVAVSRNLLRKWGGKIEYGDKLQVKGISKKLDGIYVVRDTMTKRMKNRIDILVSKDDNIMGFWDNVQIYHLN